MKSCSRTMPPPADRSRICPATAAWPSRSCNRARPTHATTVLQEHPSAATVFDALQAAPAEPSAARRFGVPLVGALGRKLTLAPGRSAKAVFLVTWFFPNYPTPSGEFAAIADLDKLHRHYALRFGSAPRAPWRPRWPSGMNRWPSRPRLWNRTWYDSTLPYWFLDRAFITLDTLATQTCHRFDSGRFYGWEGVDCCPGTCQHVWQYAQAMARVFPQLERDLRERVDFGLSWHPNGAMDYRGESGREVAPRRLRGHDPAGVSRALHVRRRGVPETPLAASQEIHRVSSGRGQGRGRVAGRPPIQHPGRRLVWPDGVVEFPLSRRDPSRARHGDGDGRRRLCARLPGSGPGREQESCGPTV